MRKAIGIGGLAALAIAVMFVTMTVPIVGADPTYDVTVDLIAGQNTDVGYVHVWWDEDYFYVDIVIDAEGWTLTDSHVAMSVDEDPDDGICDLGGIPQTKKGSPVPGHFPYEPVSEDASGASYKISFDNIGYGDNVETFEFGEEICMAVHAVVEKGSGDSYQQQTAWGEGKPFNKSWAMYFCFEPSDVKRVKLPSSVTAKITHYGGTYDCDSVDYYWKVEVTAGGSGNMPNSGTGEYYLGWCIDKTIGINSGSQTFNVYAYYDSSMPSDEWTNPWGKINWILNNKGDYTGTEIQHVIWNLCGEWGYSSLTTSEKALADAANTHGDFVPKIGDWMAVVLQNGSAQSIFIEVDP